MIDTPSACMYTAGSDGSTIGTGPACMTQSFQIMEKLCVQQQVDMCTVNSCAGSIDKNIAGCSNLELTSK